MADAFFSLFLLCFIFVCLLVPPVLTGFAVFNLRAKQPFHEKAIDILIFTLGPFLTVLLWNLLSFREWDEAILIGPASDLSSFHAPIAGAHLPTLLTLAVYAILCLCLLRFSQKGFPPLPAAFLIGGVLTGLLLCLILMVQLFPHLTGNAIPFDIVYLCLLPLNYILCSAKTLRRVIAAQVLRFQTSPPADARPVVLFSYRFLSKSGGWLLLAFLLALPVLALLLAILTLFGQTPDAAVRAFTETSDWALSQKISPPPIETDGHYLCTVAVGGHPRLVKPIRYGIRHGKRIVVNRQLCVANAFEQLIMERAPRLHRAIRQFYDTHGYPLSQKLTTPLRADITYLVMKPLEWFFLLCLYTFDREPENRIALQYTKA